MTFSAAVKINPVLPENRTAMDVPLSVLKFCILEEHKGIFQLSCKLHNSARQKVLHGNSRTENKEGLGMRC